MPRLSIRLDPGFADRKRHYPDGPYRALVDAICAAEYEPVRGQFRSMAILRAVIGRSARHIPYLIAEHDLELDDDGRVNLIGWPVWQEGNHVPAERKQLIEAARADRHGTPPPERERSPGAARVAAFRERRRALQGGVLHETPEALQDASGNALPEQSSNGVHMQDGIAVSGIAVGRGNTADAADRPRPLSGRQEVHAWLREHQIASPVGWENSKLNELVRVNGPGHVLAAFEEARSLGGAVTCRNYIRWAEQTLNPDPSPVLAGRPNGEPAEEARQRFDRGVERTQREMARIRGETA